MDWHLLVEDGAGDRYCFPVSDVLCLTVQLDRVREVLARKGHAVKALLLCQGDPVCSFPVLNLLDPLSESPPEMPQ